MICLNFPACQGHFSPDWNISTLGILFGSHMMVLEGCSKLFCHHTSPHATSLSIYASSRQSKCGRTGTIISVDSDDSQIFCWFFSMRQVRVISLSGFSIHRIAERIVDHIGKYPGTSKERARPRLICTC